MRISIVTDAWHPQVNGVVRTLDKITDVLEARGHKVQFVTAGRRPTFGLPTYPEIRLALATSAGIGAEIAGFQPDAVHIATEGTLGLAARRFCVSHDLPFTTGYHTRFPEMIGMRWPLPGLEAVVNRWFRWFHRPSRRVLVPTPSMARVLEAKGIANVAHWTRGVDHDLFRPKDRRALAHLPRPVALYAGRVAVEKSLPDFLDLDLDGSKVVVGDGPMLDQLKARYPDAGFLGYRRGEALAEIFAAADVFVFPSRTDTFGLVMIEALASGVPVAAYDVPGSRDIVTDRRVGALATGGDDLGDAVRRALACSPEDCRAHALTFTWERVADQFRSYLVPFSDPERATLRAVAAGSLIQPRLARRRPTAASPTPSK